MTSSHKINREFTGHTNATIDLNDDTLASHHRYGSYSKSTLPVHADDSGYSIDSVDTHCCFSIISYHLGILHPFGPFRCFWDFLVMIMLIYTCIEIPVTLAFNVDLSLQSLSGIMSFCIDILLLIDILITFRTAYFDKFDRLRLIIDECDIARRYITGWFFIDLLTSIPFEFIFNSSNIVKFVKILRVFRFLRIIKILRLFKMIKYFDGFMSQFVIRELLLVLKFLKIFALMLLFAHLAACLWFFVGYNTLNNDSGSWVGEIISYDKSVIDNESTFTLYSYAWYWAVVTLFTTGYGDIVATKGNKVEQWIVSICILIGTCFFAYFIGTLTSLITEGDRIKSVEIQKLEEAQAFCDQKKLPRELSRAVLTHIRYHCGYNYVFDENELIQSLPPYLQNDIHSFLAQTILMQLDFFKAFTKNGNLQILGQISLKMRSISCNEKYCLYQRGDRAKEIYIQRTGESVIDYYDGYKRRIKRGDVIGERAIISPKRRVTVICDTFSEFYVLSVQDIVSILQTEYPATWSKRWRKMVKNLKNTFKQKGKKEIRSVDFDKYKNKKKINTNNTISRASSLSTNALTSWINAGSTINTTRFTPTTKGQKKIKIKSVQLNGIGEVDSPIVNHTQRQLSLKIINEQKQEKDKENEERRPHFKNTISEGNILINRDNDKKLPPRSLSMALPTLQTSKSDPVSDKNNHFKRKKSLRFGGIFIKRNSLDRDHAIHRSARKAARKRETTHRKPDAFYDMSSSKDSSDDSGDIVPHDYDDDDDDDEGSQTYTTSVYIHREPHDDDIASAVDNMDQLFKTQPNTQHKTKRVKFMSELKLDDYDDKEIVETARSPIQNTAQKRRNIGGGIGRAKGGKFGGKRRRKVHRTSGKKMVPHHVKQTSKTYRKKQKHCIQKDVDYAYSADDEHVQINKMANIKSTSSTIDNNNTKQDTPSVDIIYNKEDGYTFTEAYSDDDKDTFGENKLRDVNSTKL